MTPAESLAPAPQTTELVDATALPLTGLAAWQTAFELAELKPGQTVLVNGAGGAVGSLVVQLAVDAGAHVTAVDAPQHADRLRGYGADRVVGPLALAAGPAAVGGPFQVVVNHVRVSPEDLAQLTNYVVDGGVAASTAGPIPEDPARGVRSASLWVRSDGAQLTELVAKVDAGKLRLHVAAHRSVAELAAVHEDAGAGRLPGKRVVLAPWSPHSFRASLRELPPAVHEGRFVGVLDLAVPALEDTGTDGALLSLHVLIDALAAEI